ncbi:MAG: OmpA family protein [Thiomicrospira sp.]|uniref:OmpA family protein n=1 Tax=Thiomicrospira sp. TaxID=935 RepID=UPI0019F6E535|nr:OmpA family protein [Thiomicrospira sp.]MBE0493135.1 OmpA family protein [Thiomicrospira sp.]
MKRITKTAGMLGIMGCAVMVSPYALADDSFWYMGGNIGQSKAKIDDKSINRQLIDSGFTSSTINADDSDWAYKLFGGYQLNHNFAIEAGYFDLGQFSYKATTVPEGTLNGKINLKGVNLDLVGFLPVNEKFSAFARVGANYARTEGTFSSSGAVSGPTDDTPTKTATHYKAGVGLQYDLSRSVGLRAEAERYRIDDVVGGQGDINMFSLGLVYRFGRETPVQPQVVVPIKVKTQEYCTILDIQFEIKQDVIERQEKEKLAVIGTFMKKYPDTTAVIEGHSDNVGTRDYNLKLSQRRAQSVVSYLVDELNIAPDRLTAVGYGETRPIADNSTREGKQANRRIAAVIACVTDIAGLKVTPARMTIAMEMNFDPYKTVVDQQYYNELANVAKLMRADPAITAAVEGHAAGRVGKTSVSDKDAMEISQKRAEAVVDHLVSKEGISRERLSTAAFGKTKRVSYDTMLKGQEENRRVNIIFNYVTK